jgi:hypothetical protein
MYKATQDGRDNQGSKEIVYTYNNKKKKCLQ